MVVVRDKGRSLLRSSDRKLGDMCNLFGPENTSYLPKKIPKASTQSKETAIVLPFSDRKLKSRQTLLTPLSPFRKHRNNRFSNTNDVNEKLGFQAPPVVVKWSLWGKTVNRKRKITNDVRSQRKVGIPGSSCGGESVCRRKNKKKKKERGVGGWALFPTVTFFVGRKVRVWWTKRRLRVFAPTVGTV